MSPIDIKVLSTTAMKTVFEELAPAFERATGNRLAVTLGPSLRLEKQLGEGETADMAIVSASGARDLVGSGRMVAGSIVDIATSSIGVAVQKGAPRLCRVHLVLNGIDHSATASR
jgi:molybdate transport system substrate-binding protein